MKKLILHSAAVVVLSIVSAAAHSSQNIVAPTLGVSSWHEDTFDLNGEVLVLDTDHSIARGVEFGHVFASGLRLGGEAQYQQVDILSSSVRPKPGYADVINLNLLVSYYAPVNDFIKPFFGVGMGSTRISFHGGPSATLDGDSYFGKTGLELKVAERVTWVLGAKASYFKVRDDTVVMKSNAVDYYMSLNFYTKAM